MLDWIKCVVEILLCGYQYAEVCVCAASGKQMNVNCSVGQQSGMEENAETRASVYR